MAIYTLTTNLIENLKLSDISIFASLFYELANNESEHKLAIDHNKIVLDLYGQANVDTSIEQYYKQWIDFLSKVLFNDNVCEFITVELKTINDKNLAFLEVASKVNGDKNIIVYSRNNNCPYVCDRKNEVKYKRKNIRVLDKRDAIKEINNKNVIYEISTKGDHAPVVIGNNNTL